MMNGIDTIIQRLNTDAKAETDALLEKARQEAAAVAARRWRPGKPFWPPSRQ